MDDVGTFDRFAPLYDLLMPPADAAALHTGLVHAEREVRRVVDVGGGTGRGVRSLDVPDPIVLDAARGMTQRARGHGISAIQGTADRIPLRDGAADAVLIVDAFHHLPDRDGALAEGARVLAPGGVLVVADFDPTTVRGRALVLAEHLVGFDSRFHTPEDLVDALAALGLEATIVDGGFGYVVAGRR